MLILVLCISISSVSIALGGKSDTLSEYLRVDQEECCPLPTNASLLCLVFASTMVRFHGGQYHIVRACKNLPKRSIGAIDCRFRLYDPGVRHSVHHRHKAAAKIRNDQKSTIKPRSERYWILDPYTYIDVLRFPCCG